MMLFAYVFCFLLLELYVDIIIFGFGFSFERRVERIKYTLTDEAITFWIDGVIVFDCPIERIEYNPQDALIAMRMLENVWKEKNELVSKE